ncbi:ROOT CAP DOMAIN-CONTAINING PROTEIN [Salix purpurea]|uniref:ROOT CAP DOMAIN-CONTAINING PROTEIN n=1 Tax=Salix purpurea TaxID=77065 RepID=A0A9Q0SVT4_SALPP|nr:ROOT CAP DOMAIN-CONTAINING PROTEIN [Salix purpurea]
MAQMKPCILAAVFVVLIAIQGTLVQGDDSNNGDNEDHDDMAPLGSGQEQAKCKAKGHCKNKILVCPAQCPEKKPTKNRKHKGCFVDCTSKCEVTCKSEWRSAGEERQVVVERTDGANAVRVTVAGLVDMDVRVRPIGKHENKVHNYQLPDNDAFAHLETQFRFKNLTDLVEGVLGKTYRPGYVSPVKIGVPMPVMGGEDKYQTPSLLSPLCRLCRFQGGSAGNGMATI